MKGTRSRKILRVFGHLIMKPKFIPKYLLTGPLSRRSPLSLRVPWFSWSAIEFLKTYLRKDMIVFEYGSGGSTLFFADRVESVLSTEENAEWVRAVQSEAEQTGTFNVIVQHRPFDFRRMQDFAESEYLRSIPSRKFDVIVIDGDPAGQARPLCFAHAERYVKKGGIIVFDDAWMHENETIPHNAKRRVEFTSVGPCRPGVTRTDVYFY